MATLIIIWGHKVWVAYDGAAALEMALDCQADVLLLDITMPKMNGYQVARTLRSQRGCEDTVLVAISGWADQPHRLLGEAAGFDHYLIKPIDCSTLEILLELEQERIAPMRAFPCLPEERPALRMTPWRQQHACPELMEELGSRRENEHLHINRNPDYPLPTRN